MFFKKKDALPLDRPIKKTGSELLPRLQEQLDIVLRQVEELDSKIAELPEQLREGSHMVDYKRQLIRAQADQVVQKEWLTQLIEVVEEDRSYLLSIGEAKILGFLPKK